MSSATLGLDFVLNKLANANKLSFLNNSTGNYNNVVSPVVVNCSPSRRQTPSFDLSAAANPPTPATPNSPDCNSNGNTSNGDAVMWNNFNKSMMKEKKKFNSDVSDTLVVEVLKRKELLVENNTSRDLTFSENKRNAWNDVRRLLMDRFPHFDLNVEAIKSHWRYRKRKVTDAYQDMKAGEFEASKIQGKISKVDYDIYEMLKESNLLEKIKAENSTASPSEGEDPSPDNYSMEDNCGENVPSSMLNPLAFLTQPLLNNFSNSVTGGADPRSYLEHLAAMLTHKAAQQQQQLLGDLQHANYSSTGEVDANHQQSSAPITSCSSSVSPQAVVEHTAGQQGNSAEEFVDTTVVKQEVMQEDCNNNNHEIKFDVAQLLSCQQNLSASNAQQPGGIMPKPTASHMPRRKRLRRPDPISLEKRGWRPAKPDVANVQSVPLPATSSKGSTDLEECQRMAFMAQREAFTELKSLIADIKTTVMPQVMLALHNYNNNNNSNTENARLDNAEDMSEDGN